MIRRVIILSITLLCSVSLWAQQGIIKGTVTDAVTGDPVPFANVLVVDTKIGASTDFDGNYKLAVDTGTYDIRVDLISYDSYEIKDITVKSGEVVVCDVALSASVEHLSEIVIVDYNYKAVSESSNSVLIISSQEIRQVSGLASKGRKGKAKRDKHNYPPPPPAIDVYPMEAQYDREGYEEMAENEFIAVQDEALSTFSIDVDRASYANMRRQLNYGSLPTTGSVRTEELINYFHYNYEEPTGDHPFAVTTEMAPCPWNKNNALLRIGLKAEDVSVDDQVLSNYVFLIDVSGSMGGQDKLGLLKSSLKMLVQNLKAEDRVAIVVYAGAAGVVLPSTKIENEGVILRALDKLNAGGSTAGGAGIELAYAIAKENFIEKGNNRVILATDGDFNVGVSSDAGLVKLIEKKRDEGVFLTVLGFGTGNYQDAKMEKLADHGNGNFAYIDRLSEAKKTLVDEQGGTLYTVAKDVKLQLEFNPAQVVSYRLIGYENRLLNKEDFNDDTKDAGEIGAGHTVTALYELVLGDSNKKGEKRVDDLKYQHVSPNKDLQNNGEYLTVKLRYKKPDENTSQLLSLVVTERNENLSKASTDLRFAAAVAQFSMLLNNSKYKGGMTYKSTKAMALAARGTDEFGYRSEFIQLVGLAEALDERGNGEARSE